VKIDSTRYRLFLQSPEIYRLKEVWRLEPEPVASGMGSLQTFGLRRGSCFHDLQEGIPADEAKARYGEEVFAVAHEMHEANLKKNEAEGLKVLWSEKEFDIPVPNSPHRMVGRIDSLAERWEETFINDYKTSKHRTKEDFRYYCAELERSAQVDFYLSAVPEARKFVFRVLWKKPRAGVNIHEVPTYREAWRLKVFQRGVHQVCETIESYKREFGTEDPWPVGNPYPRDLDRYAPILQRKMYEGAVPEGFRLKQEHLAVLREGVNASH
jgi:hypothetical protein